MNEIRPSGRAPHLALAIFAVLTAVWALLALFFFTQAPATAGDSDRNLSVRQVASCEDERGLGIITAGIGLDSLTSGVFTVTEIPAGASVLEAWLYWNGADDGNSPNDDPVTFNPAFDSGDPTVSFAGAQVTDFERIGGPASWTMPGVPGRVGWYAYAYRADVSDIVTANGTYEIEGLDNLLYTNGAELLIMYSKAGMPLNYVGIAEGLDIAFGFNGPSAGPGTKAVVFQFEAASVKRFADITLFLGGAGVSGETAFWYRIGAEPLADPASIALVPAPGATPHPDSVKIPEVFTGVNNANSHGYWDIYARNITIPPGATWLAVQAESVNTTPLVDRSAIDWIGAVMHMPLVCSPKVYMPLYLN